MNFASSFPSLKTSRIGAALAVVCIGLAGSPARAQVSMCGSLENAYGPFDYRTDRDKLPIVDGAHFTSLVENLVSGATGRLGGDIDYTLRAFPNHHRALIAMTRLGEKEKTDQPGGAKYTVECYYDRALRFKSNDTTVRMLYASYLAKHNRREEAFGQLDEAARLAGDNGFTHYNAGLFYLELKNYPKALQESHRAIELGFTRPELPDLLKAAGKWVEPAADAASSPASSASAAAAAQPASAPASAASGP